MSRPVYTLTEADVKEANRRFLRVSIGGFNYATQNGTGVVYGLAKALRKLYPNDDDYATALLNESKYFNSQPYFASAIIGAALAMEQELGIEGKDAIQDFKTGLMGPTAGIGDSIFWIMMPAIFTPIAAAMAYEGSIVGWLIECAYWCVLHVFRRRFFLYGYQLGGKFVPLIRDQLPLVTDSIGILGLIVLGALIPSTITVKTPLAWTLSTGSQIVIQDLLDKLVPNFLAIVITAAAAKLLVGKKITMVQLVFAVLILGIVLSTLGVLA